MRKKEKKKGRETKGGKRNGKQGMENTDEDS
jgi:hypothetical protein